MNKKLMEQELPEAAQLARTIAENSVHGLVVMDDKGTCIYANQSWLDMTGFTMEEMQAKPLHDLVHHHHPDGRPFPLEECPIGCTLGKNQNVRNHEDLFFRKDGSPFPVSCAASPIVSNGAPVLMILETRDISEEKKAQEKLRASEATLRMTLDAIPQMVWSYFPDQDNDYLSRQWQAFTGIQPGSLKRSEWLTLVHPDDRPALLAEFSHSLATGVPYEFEHRIRHHTGEYRWGLARALPVRDETNAVVRWFGTFTDIHDQKLLQQRLQDADRRKDEFLAMLAHELRNPLAPISAAADLLGLGRYNEEWVKQASEIISRQVRHMTGLVDELLDVSRVTRGLISLDRATLDAKRIVAEAIEQATPLLEARGHHLALHVPPSPALMQGDRKRMVQVVANLLNNAAKYTPEGGNIVLGVDVQANQVRITVEDNGIGMTAEVIAQAFELFSQADRTSDRSQGGLGIGLALVKSLVELHGGTVTAESEGPERGSRFTVALPHLDAQATVPPGEQDLAVLHAAVEPLKVMVVDDNADAARTLAMLVEAMGHRVSVEHNPGKALERAKSETPDVFLLDIGLPEMDGTKLARQIRVLPETASSVLVAVTGYGQDHGMLNAADTDFDYHFVKPADSRKLAALLNSLKRTSAVLDIERRDADSLP